jgi:hypothetical protein
VRATLAVFSSVVCPPGRARHLTLDAWNPDGALEGAAALPSRLEAVSGAPRTLCGRATSDDGGGVSRVELVSCGLCDTLRREVVLAAYEAVCVSCRLAPSVVAARYGDGAVVTSVLPDMGGFDRVAARSLFVTDGAVSSLALELPAAMSRVAGQPG